MCNIFRSVIGRADLAISLVVNSAVIDEDFVLCDSVMRDIAFAVAVLIVVVFAMVFRFTVCVGVSVGVDIIIDDDILEVLVCEGGDGVVFVLAIICKREIRMDVIVR